MDQGKNRVVRSLGTVAAVGGFVWLLSVGDRGFDEWHFTAGVLTLGGLLLRIEAAVAGNRR